MSRQQRRHYERELKKTGEGVTRFGLPVPSTQAPVMGLTAVIRKKLREHKNMRRASEAAAIVARTFDVSIKNTPAEIAIACKKSCSFCCHTFVSVLAPEVFYIAEIIRREGSAENTSALIERSARSANLDLDARHGKHIPCPLLTEETTTAACSVYSNRPLVCRKAVSVSLEACRVEYDGGEAGLQMPFVNQSLFGDANLAMQIALHSCSLSRCSYELSAALKIALTQQDAERRWLEGSDIFAGVYIERANQGFDDMVARLASEFD